MRASVYELPLPRLKAIRRALVPLLFIATVALSYDVGVLDLQSTKRAALLVAASLWALVALARGFREPAKRIAFGIPLLVLCWALMPALARGAPAVQVLEQPMYFAYLALSYVLMRNELSDKQTWAGFLWGLVALALVLAVSAVIEVVWLGGEPVFAGAPVVTFGNPNHLGAALVMLMPAVLACLDARQLRHGVLVVGGIAMLAIGLTGSYLALMGASAVLGIAAASPMWTRRRRLLVVSLLALMLCGGFLIHREGRPQTPEVVVVHAEDTQSSADEPTGFERALQGRIYLAERGVDVWAHAPMTGIGPGEYAWGFALMQADHLEENPDEHYLHTRLVHAHNDPLELLAEYGVLGILGLLLGFFLLGRISRWSPLEDASHNQAIPAFAVSGLALFAILSLGHFVLFAPQVAVIGLAYLATVGGRRVSASRWVVRMFTILTIGLTVLGLSVTIRAYSAERLVVDALEHAEAGESEAAIALLDEAQTRHPSATIAFHRGTIALSQNDLKRAIESLEYAAWMLPYSEVHLNYGLALCQAGQDDAAIAALEMAVRLDPVDPRPQAGLLACQQAISH